MADPARQVYYVPENLLEQQWQSKAALYFEEVLGSPKSTGGSSWAALLSMKLFPNALWIIVPFLNIFAAFLGIAMSWALQRGINDSLAGKKDSLVVAIVLLLFIITLFKSFFSYIRQWILITLNNSVNEQLMQRLIRKIVRPSCNNFCFDKRSIKSSIAEIQKMQNAITVFMATLLSDGSLILLILCGIVYAMPLAGLINVVYIVVVTALTIRKLPGLSFEQAHLNEQAAATENFMMRELQSSSSVETNNSDEHRVLYHRKNHARFLGSARSIAVRNNKMTLLFECLGTLNVILVFTLGLVKLQQENMGYGSFMVLVILSYFIAALMPKICNALYIISDGAEASLQYKAQLPLRP
jgi:ABC-type bacteriocin/lantibiotic exporter with double-glycine peptidase domain